MFRVANRLASNTDDLRAIQLAIGFVDAVYDSCAKDNKARIANVVSDLLG